MRISDWSSDVCSSDLEGWAWVEAVPHLAYEERQAFQNAPRHRREPTTREARRIASLETRLEKIDAELEEACDAEDEAKAEKLEQRREQVVGALQDAEEDRKSVV